MMLPSVPPLRLILNTNCNGHCRFCHNEGCEPAENMPKSIILECARIAQEMHIPCISLTGGEPTLRYDLAEIINEIRNICVDTYINLTSNGCNLLDLCELLSKPVDSLNLSMTSFDRNIASHFQDVEPDKALQALRRFPAKHKNLNVVIVEENYLEITDIIKYCISESISLDIMFELKRFSSEDYKMQQYVLKKIEELGDFSINLKHTPVVTHWFNNSCKINVKHPFLSALLSRDICINCSEINECFERVCAVRVLPNAMVSPCLSQKLFSDKSNLDERIYDIYTQLDSNFSIFSFLTK